MPRPPQSLMLFTTPRSGSTMLCTLLRQVDLVGQPESWFRRENRAEFAAEWGLPPDPPFADYLAAAIHAGRSPNGTFALRMMANNLGELLADLAGLFGPGADTALLEQAFGRLRYLRLIRRDRVAQAVSLYRAEVSGLWHRNADGSPRELFGDQPRPVPYDTKAIAGYLAEIDGLNAQWDRWFTDAGIAPLTLIYEDLAADPQHQLHKLLTALGIETGQITLPTAGTARLAQADSADWVQRFQRETGRS